MTEWMDPYSIVIGRDPERCDVVVEDGSVSGVHCRVFYSADDASYYVEDLGSSNGTWIHHRQVEAVLPGAPLRLMLNYRMQLGKRLYIRVTPELLAKLTSPQTFRRPYRPQTFRDPGGAQVAVDQRLQAWKGAGKRFTLGRDPSCDIPVNRLGGGQEATRVSSKHAEIEPAASGGLYRVRDLGSRNGLYVNTRDVKVPEAVVSEKDVLYLGPMRLPMSMVVQELQRKMQPAEAMSLPTEGTHTLGRKGGGAAIELDAPMVSRVHAEVSITPAGVYIKDMGSSNGTFVNGKRITKRTLVLPDDEVSLGSYRLHLSPGQEVRVKSYDGPLTLQAKGVQVVVEDRETGAPKTLIENVSLTIYPTEFVGLMGPSGAGKTTLLQALNGYIPPTGGQAFINGRDFYESYESFQGDIGYVPQDDIVYPQLTVYEALYYTARLRLPEDTSEREIDARIDKLLHRLEIAGTKHTLIGDALNKGISGGQRKRVNLAQELLTEPSLLFLDEPTSGLASEDTLEVMRLLRELSDEGRTILLTIHQPSLSAYRLMDNVVYLFEGRLVYYGPAYPDSITFLNGVDADDDVDPVLLQDPGQALKPLAKERKQALEQANGKALVVRAAEARERAYTSSKYHDTFVKEREGKLPPTSSQKARRGREAELFGQLMTLAQRTSTIKMRDKVNTAILFAQAPIIAVVMGLVFQKGLGRWDALGALTSAFSTLESTAAALFLLVASAIWFGCSNAAREIVGEQAIYLRERMVNLRIDAYVGSKFFVLGSICVAQCLVLLTVVLLFLDLPGPFLPLLLTLILCSWAGLGMGLVLSALVRSGEAAVTLVPILLIPQIVLGGLMYPAYKQDDVVRGLAALTVARWGFEAMMHVVHEDETTEDVARLCFTEAGLRPEFAETYRPRGSDPRSVCCVMPDVETGEGGRPEFRQRADSSADGEQPYAEDALCARWHRLVDSSAGRMANLSREVGQDKVVHYVWAEDEMARRTWSSLTCATFCTALLQGEPITALDRTLGPTRGSRSAEVFSHDWERHRVHEVFPESLQPGYPRTTRIHAISWEALLRLWGLLAAMVVGLLIAVGGVLLWRDPLPS